MPESLQVTVDKFTFMVAVDRAYSPEGVWAKVEGERVRLGLADFPQQRSGDVAFVEIRPPGTRLEVGEEFATIETIKINLSLGSPAAGRILAVNPELEAAPERINQDPYGAGWLVEIEASHWAEDCARLLEPEAYFAQVKAQAETEAGYED